MAGVGTLDAMAAARAASGSLSDEAGSSGAAADPSGAAAAGCSGSVVAAGASGSLAADSSGAVVGTGVGAASDAAAGSSGSDATAAGSSGATAAGSSGSTAAGPRLPGLRRNGSRLLRLTGWRGSRVRRSRRGLGLSGRDRGWLRRSRYRDGLRYSLDARRGWYVVPGPHLLGDVHVRVVLGSLVGHLSGLLLGDIHLEDADGLHRRGIAAGVRRVGSGCGDLVDDIHSGGDPAED